MAERRYGNTGDIVVETGNSTTNTIMQMMQMYDQRKRTEARDAREESRFIMEEANAKWDRDIKEKKFNAAQSFNKWTASGWDNSLIGQEDPRGLFGAKLPNYGEQWSGYLAEQEALGINPHEETFRKEIKAKNDSYMKSTAARFNAVYSTIAANNPGFDEDDLNQHMQDNYNARNVYNNYVRQFGVEQANLNLGGYKPVGKKQGWGEWLASPFVDPEITSTIGGQEVTSGGGVDAFGVGTGTAVLGGGGYGGYKGKQQYSEAMDLFTKQYDSDVLNKKKGGIGFEKFKEKYGVTKKAAQGKSSAQILTMAKEAGYKGTWFSKAGKGKALLGPSLGGHAGAVIGEAVGGDVGSIVGGVGGSYAGWEGYKKVMKKLSDPATVKKMMPILKKRAPWLAVKLAGSSIAAAVPEPVSTVLGIGGIALTAYEIMDLLQTVPELFGD